MTRAYSIATVSKPKSDFEDAFHGYIANQELRLPYLAGSLAPLDLNAAPVACSSEIAWVPASGLAELYSFVIYRQQYFEDRVAPYNVAWVSLVEGPMLISTVIVEQLSDLKISMPLTAAFDERGVLVFMPSKNP